MGVFYFLTTVTMLKYTTFLVSISLSFGFYSQEKYNSLFWKIYGNNLKDTSFIYGTMHTQDERVFKFKDGVLKAFKKAKTYAMELNLDSINQAELMQGLVMDSSASLKTLLSKEEYLEVSTYFSDSLGLSLFFFDKIQPIYTAQMISIKELGSQKKEALDMYFHSMAKNQNKKIIGLEKMEEQLNAFNSFPYELQAKELVKAVKEAGKFQSKELEKILELYVKEDLDSLLILTQQNSDEDSLYTKIINDVLLVSRNHNMTKRSEKYLKENSVFIAVGAAHLPGEKGIINLLRKKGYLVEPY